MNAYAYEPTVEQFEASGARLFAQKSAAARRAGAERGKYPGFAPLGYVNTKTGERSEVVSDLPSPRSSGAPSGWRRASIRCARYWTN